MTIAAAQPMTPRINLRALCGRWPTLAGTAHHEGGHIVAARAFARPIVATSIDPDETHSGCMWIWPGARDATILRQNLVILAAGAIASHTFDPTSDPGDQDDAKRLFNEAWLLVGRIADTALAGHEIDLAKRRAARLIRERRHQVEAVAAALLSFHETVTAMPTLTLESLDP